MESEGGAVEREKERKRDRERERQRTRKSHQGPSRYWYVQRMLRQWRVGRLVLFFYLVNEAKTAHMSSLAPCLALSCVENKIKHIEREKVRKIATKGNASRAIGKVSPNSKILGH